MRKRIERDNYKSLRLSFEKKDSEYELVNIVYCKASAPLTDSLVPQQGITGTWIELLDDTDRAIYRKHIYAMLHSVSDEKIQEKDMFDILVPFMTNAVKIKLFAPQGENGVSVLYGSESVVLGEYSIGNIPPVKTAKPVVLPCDICGEGRGEVLEVTQVKHSKNLNAYNLVILAEKFGDNQDEFVAVASKCIDFLYSRPPYNTLVGNDAMNIWLVKIKTKDKDKPYFHVSYELRKTHVDWKRENVRAVCDALFPDRRWNYAAIIVDYALSCLGTSWGEQFVIGRYYEPIVDRKMPHIVFQHEFGHSVFNLADEYVNSNETYTLGEPNRPNVTKENTLEKLKWKNFVEADTPIPTPPDFYKKNIHKVGCIEGGMAKYKYGIYKPQCLCVMNDDGDRRVNGYFCKVCTNEAYKNVYGRMNIYIPLPGVMFYSISDNKWRNVKIAFNAFNHMHTDNTVDRSALFNELNEGNITGENFTNLMSRAGIRLKNAVIMQTEYNVYEEISIWLVRNSDSKMYYITMNNITEPWQIKVGMIKLPDFMYLRSFDGISLGVEQHIFSVDNGKLEHGILSEQGELTELTEEKVTGLQNDLIDVSVTYKSGQPRYFVAVAGKNKVQLGMYSLVSAAWDEKGFVDMCNSKDVVYEYVQVMNVENLIYVLAKGTDGIEVNIFNATSMQWGFRDNIVINNTLSVLKADWSYFNNKAWLTYISDSYVPAVKCIGYKNNSLQITDCELLKAEPLLGSISSFGTTVCNKKLHLIYNMNGEARHAIYEFIYDYDKNVYKLQFCENVTIDAEGFLNKNVNALSAHNDGSRIYLILSSGEKLND